MGLRGGFAKNGSFPLFSQNSIEFCEKSVFLVGKWQVGEGLYPSEFT